MTEEQQRPRKRLGIISILLITLVVVVVSTVGVAYAMCPKQ
jgi:hypothetical protein